MASTRNAKSGSEGRLRRPRKKVGESKAAQLEAMLRRPQGATISQIASALGWQPHTIRAAISTGPRKTKGLTVTITKEANGERVYRVTG
ncbi:DUF3489 domain-containing protein [Reyranella soli]|nr:DUF3489 domain-containing protein [Reyranella soli]